MVEIICQNCKHPALLCNENFLEHVSGDQTINARDFRIIIDSFGHNVPAKNGDWIRCWNCRTDLGESLRWAWKQAHKEVELVLNMEWDR